MRSWPKKFAPVSAAISLLLAGAVAARAQLKPAIALVDPADAQQWRTWTAAAGWQVIVPSFDRDSSLDARVQALVTAVQNAIKDAAVDPARVYLIGRGDAAATVIYTMSRVPDLWAAGAGIGGSVRPALASGRIFAANFTNTPLLWIGGPPGSEELAAKLKAGGLNLQWRAAGGLTNSVLFELLSHYVRRDYPPVADCETNSPAFARCFWLEPVKFDLSERNDSLASTVIREGSGASLDLGGFGFRTNDPGPGVLITYLPDRYSGPLKLKDRLVELDGAAIADAQAFLDLLSKITKPRQAVALIQRGKERIRLDTAIVLPADGSAATARVQGRYDADTQTLEILSRGVTALRVNIPAAWTPNDLYWDGLSIEDISKPGCYLLTIDQELLNAAPCH